MSRIRRLPDHLVNKIAAGEVVERPASVVKELAENAIDADARAVAVDLRDAGRQLVRVADDGTGMAPDEVELALARHATSKLGGDADLDAVATLGFRGEALAAICAVSRFALTSCARGRDEGVLLRGEAGAVTGRFLVPASPGTAVEAADLFFNTPARLKFMKGAASELSACLRVVHGLALAHPVVQFRVTHNGKPALTAPRAAGLRERVGALAGYDVAARLLDVLGETGPVRVTGLVGPPQLARGHRDDITLVLNGRPVRDALLVQTLLDAYRPMLGRDQYPVAVLCLEVPPHDVDVNVHPTKAWVRLRQPRLVQEAVFLAVQAALASARVVQRQGGLDAPAAGAPEAPGPAAPAPATGAAPGEAAQGGLFREAPAAFGAPRFGRVVGQLQDTFVVSASDEEVFFIDQHVAHERVLFERLQRDLGARPLAAQALLFPEALDLGPAEAERLAEWAPALRPLGFDLERLDGRAVLLRAVPALLRTHEPRRLIEAMVEEVASPRRAERQPLVERALAFVACRAAVVAPTPLAREEMVRLVADLSEAAAPFFCPHGRPIMSRLSLREIRREMHRTW
jgi:DNA mismatch repair protein MutL